MSSQPPVDEPDASAQPGDSALDGSVLDGSVLGQASAAQNLSMTSDRPNARMLEAENAALIQGLRALNAQVKKLEAERDQLLAGNGRTVSPAVPEAPQEWPAQHPAAHTRSVDDRRPAVPSLKSDFRRVGSNRADMHQDDETGSIRLLGSQPSSHTGSHSPGGFRAAAVSTTSDSAFGAPQAAGAFGASIADGFGGETAAAATYRPSASGESQEDTKASGSKPTQCRAGIGEASQFQRVLSRLVTLKVFVLLQRYTRLKVARHRSLQKMWQARLSRHILAVFSRWYNLVAHTRKLRILEGKPLYRSLVAITCELVLNNRLHLGEEKHEQHFKQDVQADLLRALKNAAGNGVPLCPEIEVTQVSVSTVISVKVTYKRSKRRGGDCDLNAVVEHICEQIGSPQSELRAGIRTSAVLRHVPVTFHYHRVNLHGYKLLQRGYKAFVSWGRSAVEQGSRQKLISDMHDCSNSISQSSERRLVYIKSLIQRAYIKDRGARAFRAWLQRLVARREYASRKARVERFRGWKSSLCLRSAFQQILHIAYDHRKSLHRVQNMLRRRANSMRKDAFRGWSLETTDWKRTRWHVHMYSKRNHLRILRRVFSTFVLKTSVTKAAEDKDDAALAKYSAFHSKRRWFNALKGGAWAERKKFDAIFRPDFTFIVNLAQTAWICWYQKVLESKILKESCNPVAVSLAMDCSFDEVLNSHESTQRFSVQIQHDVSRALSIPAENIAVLSYQKGSVVAEVAISQPQHAGDPRAMDLAKILIEQADDLSSPFRSSKVGAILISAAIHGPVSDSVCSAVRNGVQSLERQKDLLTDGLKEAFEAIAVMKHEKEQADVQMEKAESQVHAVLDSLSNKRMKQLMSMVFMRWIFKHRLEKVKEGNKTSVHVRAFVERQWKKRRHELAAVIFMRWAVETKLQKTREVDDSKVHIHAFIDTICKKANAALTSAVFMRWAYEVQLSREKTLKRGSILKLSGYFQRTILRLTFIAFRKGLLLNRRQTLKICLLTYMRSRSLQRHTFCLMLQYHNDNVNAKKICKASIKQSSQSLLETRFIWWHISAGRQRMEKLRVAAHEAKQNLIIKAMVEKERARLNKKILYLKSQTIWCWHEQLHRRLHKQKSIALCKGALRRWLKGRLLSCWERWLEAKRVLQVARRAGKRWRFPRQRLAFCSWYEVFTQAKTAKAITGRIALRWKNRNLARMWNVWNDHYRHRKFFVQAMTKWLKVVLWKSWRAWAGRVRTIQIAVALAHRLKNAALFRVFDTWLEKMLCFQKLRKRCETLIFRWSNSAIRKSWHQWKFQIVKLKQKRTVTLRVLARWRSGIMWRCWALWQEWLRRFKVAFAFARRWYHMHVGKAMRTWRDVVKKEKTLKPILSKAISRMNLSQLWKGWERWIHGLNLRKASRSIISRWLNQSLENSFNTWCMRVEESRYSKASQAKEAALQAKCWTKHKKWRCWWTWLEHNRLMCIARTVASRFKYRKAYAAVHSWNENVLVAASLKAKAKVAILRSCKIHSWRAFSTWHHKASVAIQTKTSALAVVLRWKRAVCWRALSRWLRATREICWMRGVQMKAMRMWSMGGLRRGWNRWREHVRVTGKLKRMVSLWKYLHSRRVWGRWCEAVSEAKRLRHCGRQAMSRWGKVVQWRAFATWHQHSMNGSRARKVMICWKSRRLYCAFEGWRVSAVKIQSDFNTAMAVTKKWILSLLWRSWATWKRRVRIGRISRGILTRWHVFKKSKAIDSWREHSFLARRLRYACTRVILRIIRYLCWKTFNIWMLSVSESKSLMITKSKAVRRWTNGCSFKAVKAWQLACTDTKHKKTLMCKSISRWTNSVKSTAMVTWKENLLNVQTIRVMTSRCLSRWKRLLVSVPFATWRANMENARALRAAARAVVLRWKRAVCWRALSRWLRATREICWMRGVQMKAMRMWSMGGLRRGWNRWREHVRVTGKLKRMVSLWKYLHSRRVWGRWCEAVSEAKRLRHCGRQAMSRWGKVVQWRAFATWQGTVLKDAVVRKATSKALARWSLQLCLKALVQWMFVHDTSMEQLVYAQRASRNRNLWLLWKIWRHWFAGSSDCSRAKTLIIRLLKRTCGPELQQSKIGSSVVKLLLTLSFSRALLIAWKSWRQHMGHCKKCWHVVKLNVSSTKTVSILKWREWLANKHRKLHDQQFFTQRNMRTMKLIALGKWYTWHLGCKKSKRDAFVKWNSWSQECIRKLKIENIVVGLSNRKILVSWIRKWEAIFRRRLHCQKIAHLFRLEDKDAPHPDALAFCAWRTTIKKNRQKRVALYVFLNVSCCRAFMTWRENAREQTRLCRMMSKTVFRIRYHAVAAAFDRWACHTRELVVGKRFLQKAVKCWSYSTLRKGFLTWISHAQKSTCLRGVVAKRLQRWTKHKKWRCWWTWLEHNRLMCIARTVASRFKYRKAYAAVHSWNENVLVAASLKAKAKVAILRSCKIHSWRAFSTWHHKASVAIQTKTSALAVVLRWKRAVCWRALSRWLRATREICWMRGVQMKAMRMWSMGGLRRGWNRWREHVRVTGKLKRMVSLWKYLHSRRVWGRWCEAVSEAKRLRHCGRQAMSRWGKVVQWRAFATWHQHSMNGSRARKVMICWKSRRLYCAFEGWRVSAVKIQSDFNTAMAVTKKWILSLLWRSWATWKRRVRIGRISRGILTRWHVFKKSKAIDSWREHSFLARRLRYACTRVILRIIRYLCWKTFNIWMLSVSESKSLMITKSKAVRRWTNGCSFKAVKAWQLACTDTKHKKTLMCKSISRWTNSVKSTAMVTWKENLLNVQTIRVMTSRCLSSWKRLLVSVPFATWRANMENARALRAAARAVVLRWKRAVCWRALSRWLRATREICWMRGVQMKAMRMWSMGGLRRGWNRWREHVRVTGKLKRMVSLWKYLHSRRVWGRWCEAVSEAKRLRHCGRQAMSRWGKVVQWRAFATWQGTVLKDAVVRKATSKALARWSLQCYWKCFTRWKERLKEVRLAGNVVRRGMSLLSCKVLQTWHEHTVESQMLTSCSKMLLKRWSSSLIWRSWLTWWDFDQHATARRRLRRLNHLIHLQLAWGRWSGHVYYSSMWKFVGYKSTRSMLQNVINSWMTRRGRLLLAQKIACGLFKTNFLQGYSILRLAFNKFFFAVFAQTRLNQIKKRARARNRWLLTARFVYLWGQAVAKSQFLCLYKAHSEAQMTIIEQRTEYENKLDSCMKRLIDNNREARNLEISKKHTQNHADFLRNQLLVKAARRWIGDAVARSLKTWKIFVHVRHIGRKTIIRILRHIIAKSFLKWNTHTHSLKILREHARNNILRMMHREIAAAFDTWCLFASDARGKMGKVFRVAQRIMQRLKCMAFHTWSSNCTTLQNARHTVHHIILRMMHKRCALALVSWCHQTMTQKNARKTAMRLVLKMGNLTCARAFAAWSGRSREAARLRRGMEKVLLMWHNRHISMAMMRWLAYAHEVVRSRQLLAKVVGRWTMHTLAKCWDEWTRKMRLRKSLNKIILRMMHQTTAVALYTWQDHAGAQRKMRETALRMVLRMGNLACARAFAAWSGRSQEAARLRRGMEKVLLMWHNRHISMAMMRWLAYAHEVVRSRQLQAKVVGRWTMHTLAKCWDEWTRKIPLRKAVNKIILRMMHQTTAVALYTWQDHAGAQRKMRETALRMVLRMGNLACARAFAAWSGRSQEAARLRRGMEKVLLMWHNRHISMAMMRWLAYAHEVVRSRQLLAKVVGRWTMHTLAKCWDEWTRKMRLRKSLNKIILRMMHQTTAVALYTWQDHAGAQRKMRETALRMVLRMGNLACARAFAAWSGRSQEAARLRRGMEKVLLMWHNRHISMAMMRWLAYAHEVVRSRQLQAKVVGRWTMHTLAKCWDEWTRKIPLRKAVNKIILRMMHQTTAVALYTWQDHAGAQRKMRETALRMVLRMGNLTCARAFAAWSGRSQEAARLRRGMEKVLLMWRSRHISMAMMRWLAYAHEVVRSRQLLAKVVGRWTMHTLAKCWDEWTRKIPLRKAVNKIILRMMHQTTAVALYTWQDHAGAQRKMRETALRMVLRIGNLSCARAFAAWSGRSQEAARLRRGMEKVLLMWHNRHISMAMMRWLAYAHEVVRSRQLLAKVVGRWTMHTLAKCWDEWTRKIPLRKAVNKIILRMMHQTTAVALYTWQDHAGAQRKMRETALRMVLRIGNLTCARAFAAWSGRSQEAARLRRGMEKVLLMWHNRHISMAMMRWLAYAHEVVRSRQLLAKVVGLWTMHTLGKCWDEWTRKMRLCKSLNKIILRMMHQTTAVALYTWQDHAGAQRKMRETALRMVLRMGNLACARAFAAWSGRSQEAARLRRGMEKVLLMWRSRHISMAMMRWLAYAHEVVRSRQLQAKVVGRWTMHTLGKCWDEWTRKMRLCKSLNKIILRMMHQTTAVALYTWQDHAGAQRKMRETALRMVLRIGNLSCARAFAAWSGRSREAARLRRGMEKVLLMWHNRHISMAMMRWLAYAHEVVRSRQLLAKVVGRWTMHTLAKCWDEWTRKMRLCKSLNKIILRMMHQTTAVALYTWQDHAGAQRKMRETALRMVLRMGNLTCARAFAAWSGRSQEAARLRRGMEKVLLMWRSRHISMAMMRWLAYAHEVVRSRQLQAKVVGRWTMHTLAKCWDEWTRKIPLRKAVNKIILRMMHQTTAVALYTWQDHAGAQRKMRETALRMVLRMGNLTCARAFAAWSGRSQEAARLRRGMEKVLLMWHNRHISMAMMRWLAYAHEIVRSRQLLAKVVGLWTMHTLAKCWDEWTRKMRLCKSMNKIILRMVHQTIAVALYTWQDHAGAQRKMRETALRMVLKMGNLTCARAFAAWGGRSQEAARLRRGMEKVLLMWRSRHISMAMMRWLAYAHEVVRSRQLLAKVVGLWTMHTLAKCWDEWKVCVRLSRRSRNVCRRLAKVGLSLAFDLFYKAVYEQKDRELRANCSSVLTLTVDLLQLQLSYGVMYQSTSYADLAHDLIDEMGKALNSPPDCFQLLILGEVEDKLVLMYAVSPASVPRGAEERSANALVKDLTSQTLQPDSKLCIQPIGRHIINGSAHGHMSLGLQDLLMTQDFKYRACAQGLVDLDRLTEALVITRTFFRFARSVWSQRTKRHKLRKIGLVLRRWTQATLVSFFASWHYYKSRAVKLRQSYLLTKCMQSATAAISARFVSWRDLTRIHCSARALHLAVHFAQKAAAFKTWKRYHIILARIGFLDMIIFQTHHAIKTRTLKTWSFNVICQQKEALTVKIEMHMVHTAGKAAVRWQNRMVWQALHRWRSELQEQKRIAELVSNALIRWFHALILKVYAKWRQQADKMQHSRAIVSKIILRWQHRFPAAAFERFKKVVKLQRRAKHRVEKVVRRWASLQLAKVLDCWHEHAEEKKRVASTMVKIIRKWKRILLFKGYMRWQAAVEQIIRTRNFVVATLRRWRHNELGVAWTSWSDYIEMQRRCVTIIKKVVHRWTHRTMGAAVDQWKVQMKISLTRATLIRAAIGRMKTPAWRSFARWHEAARQLVHIKYTCSKVVLRWRSGLYCKVIGTWLKRVRDRRSMRNKAITVLRKWARILLARAWMTWEDHSKRIKLAARAMAYMRYFASQKAVSAWQDKICMLQSVRMRTRKAVLHWQGRNQSKALQSWQDNVRRKKFMICKVSAIINRWHLGHRWRAFAAWQKQHRLVFVAMKAIARLHNRMAFSLLMRWRATTLLQKTNVCKLKKAVKTWTSNQESRAFCSWWESVVWSRRCRTILQRALQRWTVATLCRAFNLWYSSCRLIAFACTMLNRIRSRCCVKAIRRWSAQTKLREHLRQMVKNWKKLALLRAWITWDQCVLQKAERCAKLLRVKRLWMRSLQSLAWACWAWKVMRTQRCRAVSASVLGKWQNRHCTSAFNAWSLSAEDRAAARRMEIMARCRVAFKFQCLSTVFLLWRRSTRIRAAVNKVVVERWSSWLSLWCRLVELGNLWRNAKMRALEIGQINRVRTYFKLFARGIEKQRTHDRYAAKARMLVDHVQNAAQTQVAVIQEHHTLSCHQLEDEFQRKVLNARAARLLLSRNVINRMHKIQKAVVFDNLMLVSTLLHSRLLEATVQVERICKRKAWALCGRYLHQWVTEVQASRIEVLESANRDAEARVTELLKDKAALQALVEEALKEQDQLAMEYHTIIAPIAAKSKREKKGKAHRSRSRSPQRSKNPVRGYSVSGYY